MNKLKVMTVVGTRPEIIRLARVMNALDNSDAIEHVIVHTGQNYDYELNQIFFDDLQIRKPDHFLNAAGATATETIGKILINIDPLLENLKPDAFLVLGDTNSCLCAIPAKKRHIPIFHMEAGNRCFDQRVPEEINRKISDHISKKFESAGDDLVEIKKIGVAIATELGSKLLAAKVPGLHFYTMNTAESTLVIAKNLGLVK